MENVNSNDDYVEKPFLLNGLKFVMTCPACPEQYEVFNGAVQVGYVRLRHGFLRCDYPDHGGETVYEASPDGDGCFNSEKERLTHLTHISLILNSVIRKNGSVCDAQCE